MFCIPPTSCSRHTEAALARPQISSTRRWTSALRRSRRSPASSCRRSSPGIVSGALIAFTMSFDDFVISYFTTGNGVNNISILVLHHVQARQPSINALSTLVIVAITLVLGIVNLVPILHEREKEGKKRRKISPRREPQRMAAVAGVLVLAILGGTVGVSLSQQHKNAAAVESTAATSSSFISPASTSVRTSSATLKTVRRARHRGEFRLQ